MANILVVDDEKGMRVALGITLKREGHTVRDAASAGEVLGTIDENTDLVMTDLKMKGMDGLQLLQHVKQASPTTEVIVMTAYGSIETAVKAMRMGAYTYITKPFQPEEMVFEVERALEHRGLQRKVRLLERQVRDKYSIEGMIGNSRAMHEVFKLVNDIAHTECTVLVTGESGTGKELIAKALHQTSPRGGRPMMTVNCAAIPEYLQESEFFGHARGSFTGAVHDKKGILEEADGSTVFLDEVSLASTALQSKLLRFLQNGELRRVGDTRNRMVDVRLIAASNTDLSQAVQEGSFREDLFFRLNVVPIQLPPLRQRRQDIPLLVQHFIDKHQHRARMQVRDMAPEALDLMVNYRWPGNVRELENAIEYALSVSRDHVLTVENLPLTVRNGRGDNDEKAQPGRTLQEVEREHIKRTLKQTEWNQEKAARQLGIGRTTLWRKIKRYDLQDDRP